MASGLMPAGWSHGRTVENGGAAPVVTSAGALIHGLNRIGAKKIAVLTPYMKPLTALVEDRIGIPVLSAAVCTTHQMLQTLGLKTVAPNAGALLSGRY